MGDWVPQTAQAHGARILAIGLDAAEADLVERWMVEGTLPTVAAIARRGAYVRLESMAETFSDAVWPSFNTGAGPATHGYYHFRQVRPGTARLAPTLNRSYRRPFWWQAAHHGRRAVVFDVPKAPLDDATSAVQIVGWGEHFPFIRGSRPPGLMAEIHRRFGRHPHIEEVYGQLRVRDEQRVLQRILRGARQRAAITRYLMRTVPWDLFLTVFSEAHGGGHQFWHHLDPDHYAHDPARAPALRDATKTAYAAVDRAIASILQDAPPDADILVFSVHGMESAYVQTSLVGPVLVGLGYQVPRVRGGLSQPAARRSGDILLALRRHLPAGVRERINRVLPRHIQEGVIGQVFESACDWTRTTAVSEDNREGVPWIRINLRGREPWGTVAPGREYEEVCRRIIDDIMQLTIHPDGHPAVRAVLRTDALFQGPRIRHLPDLIVEWARGTPFAAVRHPKVGLITSAVPLLQGETHTRRGFLAAAGPHIRPAGGADAARIIDLAPTLLHLLGVPVPADMEGRPLSSLLPAATLAQRLPEVEERSTETEMWDDRDG